MTKPHAVALGILGGFGAAALLFGVGCLTAGLLEVIGNESSSEIEGPRAWTVLTAGAVAGAFAGGIGPHIRSPAGAAVVGVLTAALAQGVFRAFQPGAESWSSLAETQAERIALLVLSGIPGLAAPLLWAPVAAGARAHSIFRGAAEIAVRIGAFIVSLFAALVAAPVAVFTALLLFAGVGRLPHSDTLLIGVASLGATSALISVSMLCLMLAIPGGIHDKHPLAGFERWRSGDGDA